MIHEQDVYRRNYRKSQKLVRQVAKKSLVRDDLQRRMRGG